MTSMAEILTVLDNTAEEKAPISDLYFWKLPKSCFNFQYLQWEPHV